MPDCLGTLSSTLCQISAFKRQSGNILTLVVPWLHNMFMVLLIFALGNINIGATKPSFWILVPLGGEGGGFVRAWAWFVIII